MNQTVTLQPAMDRYLVGDLFKDVTNPGKVHYVFRVELTSDCFHFESIPNLFPDFIRDLRTGSHIRFVGKAMYQQESIARFLNYLFEAFDGLVPEVLFEGSREKAVLYLRTVVKQWI